MIQEFAVYALVAFCIGTMLVLCIDVIRRNNKIIHSSKTESASEIVETMKQPEKPLAYPLHIYVDCSRELLMNHSAYDAQESNVLAPGPSAAASVAS